MAGVIVQLCLYAVADHVVDNHYTLQAVGIIAAVGDSVCNLKVGTPAAIMTFGSYAEFTMVHYSLELVFNVRHKFLP